ncbi:ELWxxDGT repeat protein, partial [Halotia wernerae UHCC 0503]|nr:ELWxxDGT repeat protein [Halotia wernerae UHCC 0503]
LWKSDGTTAGTVLVEDIKPGSGSSNISELTNVDGTLYFNADDGIYVKELWALNTNTPVASPIVSITAIDANAAEAGNEPAVFRISRIGDTSTALTVKYNIDGTATNGQDYNQLTGSINIAAGQSFVDLAITPISDTFPEGSETVSVTLFDQYYQYYVVDSSANAATATIADDTSAVVLTQPYPLKDIYTGLGSSDISYLTKFNGILYFTADDGIHGRELWKSNGMVAGTVLVKDIVPGFGGSDPNIQINIDNILYFTADDGTSPYTYRRDLWKSDGTQNGTVLVKDLPGSDRSYAYTPTNVNGSLYFFAYESSGSTYSYNLWKSNGTTAGTIKLKTSDYTLWNLINVNDIVYFTYYDQTYGQELWKSDGTIAGTVRVKDINPGSGGSNISNFFSINNTLYFFANDGTHGKELWKSDGTAAGTVRITDINLSFYNSSISNLRNTLYFTVSDQYGYAKQLWTSDGTAAGTVLVKDISQASSDSLSINLLTNFNDSLYFTINKPASKSIELWTSDGTAAGTVLVKDINSVYYYATNFSNLTEVDSLLYFTYGDTLWKTDGTKNGTVLVKDINVFAGNFSASINIFNQLIDANGTLYFSADDGIHGNELWKSDGTEEGTVLVKDLNPGATGSNPSNLTYLNDTLYFTADDGIHGNELWAIKTDDVINGNDSRDPLIGTNGSDRIIGGTGSKTITGGAGNDQFVYTSIREVGHRITDFTVGSDKIVLTQLLDSLVTGGYKGSDAFADGYVRVVQGSTANSTIVQIDRDGLMGSATFRPFIELDNVTPQAMNNINNFVF